MIDSRTPRVLIATVDVGGHLPHVVAIGTRITTDGGSVHVLGHEAQRTAVTAAGLPFSAYRRGRDYSPLEQRTSLSGLLNLIGLVCDRGVGADLVDVAAREGSELLLVDLLLLGGLRAGTRARLPTVALVPSLPGFFTGPWAHGPIGVVATLRGLRPTAVWRDLAGAVTVCLPELVGAETAWGGPVVGPVWPGTARPATRRPGRPRVLVSLSTHRWAAQQTVAGRLLEVLGAMDVDAVFTAGDAIDTTALRVPGNVELRHWVDHDELMPEVDLVIGHGGHGTTMRALAHDLPVLMLPMHPMVDQSRVARAVTDRGAGLGLPCTAPTRALAAATHRLLTEPAFRAAAAELGTLIRARDGAGTASTYLRDLAVERDGEASP